MIARWCCDTPGTALIHDGFIKHGVEPVTNGTRYSLIVFFAVGHVNASISNKEAEAVDVFWLSPAGEEVFETTLEAGQHSLLNSFPEHKHLVRLKVSPPPSPSPTPTPDTNTIVAATTPRNHHHYEPAHVPH